MLGECAAPAELAAVGSAGASRSRRNTRLAMALIERTDGTVLVAVLKQRRALIGWVERRHAS